MINKEIQEKSEALEFSCELDDLTIHKLAEITPSSTTYSTMLRQIANDGQLRPVLVYRGQIVDGRHRYRALRELGINEIRYYKMPNNLSLAHVREYLISIEVGHRHQTITQKAIFAYKEMHNSRANGVAMTNSEAAEMYGTKVRMIEFVNKIGGSTTVSKSGRETVRHNRPDILEMLFNGGHFNIGDEYNKRPADSLSAIANHLDRLLASVTPLSSGLEGLNDGTEEKPTDEDVIFVNQVINALENRSLVCKKYMSSRVYAMTIGEK